MPADNPPRPMRWRRSPEATALFNAALTSELIATSCHWRQASGVGAMAWTEAFLVLPIALHAETRRSLPAQARVTLSRWATQNPAIVGELASRVDLMSEQTRRAIRFGLRGQRLELRGATIFATGSPKSRAVGWPAEVAAATRAAKLYGRWLASIETHEVVEILGIGV
ncbi:three component ABC system middle component [Microbacterium oleivorans]|uniref:three component ABC system middle component n=1 Tax=Microbacterium oleivorans TaxID=273677 RepID=UPI0034DEDE43